VPRVTTRALSSTMQAPRLGGLLASVLNHLTRPSSQGIDTLGPPGLGEVAGAVPGNASSVIFRVESIDRLTHRGNRCGQALTGTERFSIVVLEATR
jgi:hypothetical protein